MNAAELIEYIRTAEKKTPVKVYLWERSPTSFPNARVFPAGDGTKIVFGDWRDIGPAIEARRQPTDTLVTIEGVVTAPPGLFDDKTLYLQDGSGGAKLYRSGGFAAFRLGDRLRATGYSDIAYGEWELRLPASREPELLGNEALPAPVELPPGTLAAHPGELVQVSGTVEGWSGTNWYLNDGAESLFIYHDRDTGVRRPYLKRGQGRAVTGIVGWTTRGPRLMPRYGDDIELLPGTLPTTGAP